MGPTGDQEEEDNQPKPQLGLRAKVQNLLIYCNLFLIVGV